MTDEKAQVASVPRIGDLIDKATQGGVRYDTDIKPVQDKLHLQAAMAAIVANDEYYSPTQGKGMAQLVDDLLKQQAGQRDSALYGKDGKGGDEEKVLAGQTLGKLSLGDPKSPKYLEMPVMAKEGDLKDPKDKELLRAAQQVAGDANWRVAEGASNVTYFARDMAAMVNGNADRLSQAQKDTIRKGFQAEHTLEQDLVRGKTVSEKDKKTLETALYTAMDTAATAAGIDQTDAKYKNYRTEMKKGIEQGVDAIARLPVHDVDSVSPPPPVPNASPATAKTQGK